MSKTDILRLERLNAALQQFAGEQVRAAVMAGSDEIKETSSARRKARWVREAMERLDALSDTEARHGIMEECGHQCAASNLRSLKKVQVLYRQTGDLDQVLAAIQQGAVRFRLRREGDVVHIFYERCFCSLVNAAQSVLSPTYCYCSKGFTQTVWEGILGRPVKVALARSIVAGASECEIVIDTQMEQQR